MSFPILSLIFLMPLITALIVFLNPEREVRRIKTIAIVMMGINLLLSIFCFVTYDVAAGGFQFVEKISWVPDLGIDYIMAVDGISMPLVLLTSLIIFAGTCISWDMDERTKEFYIFLMILVAGVYGVFMAQNMLFFYIFFEFALVPMYPLIGIWGSKRKEYAAMKLVLYLLIGSVFVLIGMIAMFLYAATPEALGHYTLNMSELFSVDYPASFQVVVYGLFALGLGFLVKMFPFHTWSPLGYAAAPTAVSMLHAGVIVKLGGYGLIRLGVSCFPDGAQYWGPVIGILCMVNIVYGACIALVQNDLKLLVGYACVSHMGYILLGISTLNNMALAGAVSQMVAHGLMTSCYFALIGFIYHQAGTRNISDFQGIAKQMPRMAVAFSMVSLACLGLPGMFNFVAEFMIFMGSFTSEKVIFGFISYKVLAIIAISGIVITATYALRAVRRMFFGPHVPELDYLHDIHGIYLVAPIVLLTGLLIFGIWPHSVVNMVQSGVAPIVSDLQQATLGGIF